MLFDDIAYELSGAAGRDGEKIFCAMFSYVRGEFREPGLNVAVFQHQRSINVTGEDGLIGC